MALSLQAGTVDPKEGEYFTRESGEDSILVYMHLDTVDGIARDVVEGLWSLPRRGVEVGGLLLGHVEPGERPKVWIDRYQRLECQHRFGPQFALDEEDIRGLEKAADGIYQSSDLHVVGFYRSHTHAGFQLEEYDFELIGRYFSDPSDLILVIKPESSVDISAQFFARGGSGEVQPSGAAFPFRGRVVGSLAGDLPGYLTVDPPVERTVRMTSLDAPAPVVPVPDTPGPDDGARQLNNSGVETPGVKIPDAGAAPGRSVPRENFRRLVPDFAPLEEQRRPARAFMSENIAGEARPPLPLRAVEPSPAAPVSPIRQWWPLAGATILVVGAAWLLLPHQPPRESAAARISPETASTAPGTQARPLGLYVDPSGQTWRISWNPGATAFRGARGVKLFVRDGDDQNRIDLSPQDLLSGTYQYQAKGQDVTFRLEVTDNGGHLSAESFRLLKVAPTEPEKPLAAPGKPPVESPQSALTARNTVRPRAVHKVPPVVPAGIRPRIKSPIPIDIRVNVDSHGRVTEAIPTTKQHSGLESYLVDRAVAAARLWRFDPAREDGKAVPGTETIHFVFER